MRDYDINRVLSYFVFCNRIPSVSDDVQNLPIIFVEDVQPATAYQLRVRAKTNGGIVTAEYDLVTLDVSGQAPTPDRINRAGRQLLPSSNADSGHVVLPWWLIGAVRYLIF